MDPNFYVYTPGFDKRLGSFNLLKLAVLGLFPDYEMHRDSSVHLVHKKYKIYLIRISLRHLPTITNTFYSKIDTMLYFEEMLRIYPNALYELAVADWQCSMLGYNWYKHFTYSKIFPLKMFAQQKETNKIHPLIMYLE